MLAMLLSRKALQPIDIIESPIQLNQRPKNQIPGVSIWLFDKGERHRNCSKSIRQLKNAIGGDISRHEDITVIFLRSSHLIVGAKVSSGFNKGGGRNNFPK
jgi:hypothetical protein